MCDFEYKTLEEAFSKSLSLCQFPRKSTKKGEIDAGLHTLELQRREIFFL